MSGDKTAAANRHHGGPGSSHQRPDLPDPTAGRGPKPGEPTNGPTNGPTARVSGGGGEIDRRHSHNPEEK